AAELLPALDVFAASARIQSGFIFEASSYWALRPLQLLEFVQPRFIPTVNPLGASEILLSQHFRWASTVFAGGIALLLAAMACRRPWRKAWPFAALAILSLWLALGAGGWLLPALWQVIPPLGWFRFPEKYVGLFIVALVP